jgi:DNA replication initiation complex subunit (GINS family)
VYEDIVKIWETETQSDDLQDLEDLKLTRMVKYLSDTRLSLAQTPSESSLQADITTQEILNLEYMLKDLLQLRRRKIVSAALTNRRPIGAMTLAEEELYNRIVRGLEGHQEFMTEALAGSPAPSMKKKKKKSKSAKKKSSSVHESGDVSYVLVRFLREIKEPFMGIDEEVYGPFKSEDVATIPSDNAKTWLRDGTVERVVVGKTD